MQQIQDMSNTFIEHSIVIDNFVIIIGGQLRDSTCRVFGDGPKYKWPENNSIPIVPDVSINCDIKNRRNTVFTNVPKFIMEVLSDSTASTDRNEKMELYRKVEVSEYWLTDWRKKQVEIYLFSPDERTLDGSEYILYKKVNEKNKGDLELVTFPNLKITFDELFQDID